MSETTLNDHSARAHALLSASSAHRWLACPPSAVASELYNDETSDYAAEGTLAHEVAEQVVRARLEGRPHNFEPDEEKGITGEMIECAEAYADMIQERMTSPNDVVLLEQKVDFSKYVPGGFGTCDCNILTDKKLIVIDYKYGAGVKVDAYENPQMKLYAVGSYLLFSDLYDFTEIELVIFQPRMDNNSDFTTVPDALLTWAEKTVKPTAEQAAKGKGKHAPGDHCKFCPHAGRCRALGKLCTETAKNLVGKNVKVDVLTDFEIGEILALEPLVSLAFRKIKTYALDRMLSGGSIEGWKVVEGKLGNRAYINEVDAFKQFKAAGYQDEDITETKLLSPAQMEKKLGKKKIAELMEALTHRAPGAPTLAKADDKRPAYDRVAEAVKDFD